VSDHDFSSSGSSALPPPGPAAVPEPRPKRPAKKPFWQQRVLLPVWLWLLLGVVAAGVIVFATSGGDDEVATSPTTLFPPLPTEVPPLATEFAPLDTQAPPPVTEAVPPVSEVVTTVAPPTTAAAPPVTEAVTTTVAPTTVAPTTVAPTTVAPTTVAPTTVAPTTVAPTTTSPATTTTTTVPGPVDPDAPAVLAVGTEGPCRFGSSCLSAGFTIVNFDVQPTRYVCEFQDGSRFTYRFGREGVTYACATANPQGTITIEVDGVRSNTLTRT
jgi:hypothetical protein